MTEKIFSVKQTEEPKLQMFERFSFYKVIKDSGYSWKEGDICFCQNDGKLYNLRAETYISEPNTDYHIKKIKKIKIEELE